MTILRVDDFKAKLKSGVRSNLFTAEIKLPAIADMGTPIPELSNFLIKTAELPGSTITPIIVPFRGRQLKLSGDRTFDPWTVTVLNDPQFIIRTALERWMSAMNNHEDNQGADDPTVYTAQLKVQSLDRDANVLREYTFESAWPSDLGPISVSYDNENTLQEYQVTFQYQYWTSTDLINNSTGGAG